MQRSLLNWQVKDNRFLKKGLYCEEMTFLRRVSSSRLALLWSKKNDQMWNS